MRIIFLFIFLCCVGLIGYAQYLQHIDGLLPCPLCVAQRVTYWLLGLTALLAFMHNPKNIGWRLYGGLTTIFALAGAIIAFRQSWLIRYPESFECGISPEEKFLNALPIAEWWPGMFEANGDCTDVDWEFLSLAIPDWSFIAFVSLGLLAVFTIFAERKS
jgi:protein dithiol:quinone oxidoreductase